MRLHETLNLDEKQSSSMLKGYEGDHGFQYAIELENRPHFTRDDIPVGVIIDHPRRGKNATAAR